MHKDDNHSFSRRGFLQYGGLLTGSAILGASCKKKKRNKYPGDYRVELGEGDIGISNYVFAMEQLSIQFYDLVLGNPYTGMSAVEHATFTDIRNHEVTHAEYYKLTLADNIIQEGFKTDFTKIDFTDRASVLEAAKRIEDMTVAAYNGIIFRYSNTLNMGVVSKIVSVEARHAACIREMIEPNSFASDDVIDIHGLDKSIYPEDVVTALQDLAPKGFKTETLPNY
ncbi:MAG: ferritin-like domain-containing protein [Chitinophagales bacterium]|nr:ferritin-like domain-containing protein [Chitinophagaceae bacterium]MCB9065667.1 ferritin-like domain-containing protein [Chitinophagales bacterium]